MGKFTLREKKKGVPAVVINGFAWLHDDFLPNTTEVVIN